MPCFDDDTQVIADWSENMTGLIVKPMRFGLRRTQLDDKRYFDWSLPYGDFMPNFALGSDNRGGYVPEKKEKPIIDQDSYCLRVTVTLEKLSDPESPKHRRTIYATIPTDQLCNINGWGSSVAPLVNTAVLSVTQAEGARVYPANKPAAIAEPEEGA